MWKEPNLKRPPLLFINHKKFVFLPAVTEAYLHHGKIVKITKEVDDEPGRH